MTKHYHVIDPARDIACSLSPTARNYPRSTPTAQRLWTSPAIGASRLGILSHRRLTLAGHGFRRQTRQPSDPPANRLRRAVGVAGSRVPRVAMAGGAVVAYRVRFSWHKSDTDGRRVYEVWSTQDNRLIYQGRAWGPARRVYNRAVEEAKRLDEYNQQQVVLA